MGVTNVFADIRDGQMPNTVKIGTHTWLTEHLGKSGFNTITRPTIPEKIHSKSSDSKTTTYAFRFIGD
ncbi:MAG: hypothetical protein GY751_12715 [Bacteroidetes bacterium]|nr:hypothetical protein [Bacteroidota bacterium]